MLCRLISEGVVSPVVGAVYWNVAPNVAVLSKIPFKAQMGAFALSTVVRGIFVSWYSTRGNMCSGLLYKKKESTKQLVVEVVASYFLISGSVCLFNRTASFDRQVLKATAISSFVLGTCQIAGRQIFLNIMAFLARKFPTTEGEHQDRDNGLKNKLTTAEKTLHLAEQDTTVKQLREQVTTLQNELRIAQEDAEAPALISLLEGITVLINQVTFNPPPEASIQDELAAVDVDAHDHRLEEASQRPSYAPLFQDVSKMVRKFLEQQQDLLVVTGENQENIEKIRSLKKQLYEAQEALVKVKEELKQKSFNKYLSEAKQAESLEKLQREKVIMDTQMNKVQSQLLQCQETCDRQAHDIEQTKQICRKEQYDFHTLEEEILRLENQKDALNITLGKSETEKVEAISQKDLIEKEAEEVITDLRNQIKDLKIACIKLLQEKQS